MIVRRRKKKVARRAEVRDLEGAVKIRKRNEKRSHRKTRNAVKRSLKKKESKEAVRTDVKLQIEEVIQLFFFRYYMFIFSNCISIFFLFWVR